MGLCHGSNTEYHVNFSKKRVFAVVWWQKKYLIHSKNTKLGVRW